jgi:hypothetical protein
LGVTSVLTVGWEGVQYANNARSRSNYVVLGELEQMRDFILSQAAGQKEIYFMGEQKFYQNYTRPFDFVFEEKGVIITKVRHLDALVPGKPLFYVADEGEEFLADTIAGHPVMSEKRIGQVTVFMLKNE